MSVTTPEQAMKALDERMESQAAQLVEHVEFKLGGNPDLDGGWRVSITDEPPEVVAYVMRKYRAVNWTIDAGDPHALVFYPPVTSRRGSL